MRWRPVAAAAAGVVAVVGLGSHRAAADTGEETPDPTSSTSTTTPAPPGYEEKFEDAAALNEIAQSIPPAPHKKTAPVLNLPADVATVIPPTPAISIGDQGSLPRLGAGSAPPVGAKPAESQKKASVTAAARAAILAEAAAANNGAPAAEAPSAAPTDDQSPTRNATPATAAYATTTGANTNSTTPNLPPSMGGVSGTEQWWPTWAGDLVDQRLATAWRSTPVRGPPPGTASALGNDGRTTIYQVSVVDGRDGFDVSIAAAQTAVVNNAGLAQADAISSGSATATGDRARTSIYQTTVVVQRGTGTATVDQATQVDNLGLGIAASAGSASAQAVGNASSTTVSQTAVVLLLGSGDAHVSQTADVMNAGGATAVATDRQSSAFGSTATTDVSQLAVLVVHNDDVTVTQTSSISSVGVGNASGGTAIGNNATNTVSQVSVWR